MERYLLEKGYVGAAIDEGAPPRCVVTIEYDFKEQADRDAWYSNFLAEGGDGCDETATAPGHKLCQWYRSLDSPTKVGFYEEWDSKESQLTYAKERFASGFLAKWFDLTVDENGARWGKLKEDGGVNVQYYTLSKGFASEDSRGFYPGAWVGGA